MPKSSHSFLAALFFLLFSTCSQAAEPIALGVYYWEDNRLAPADDKAINDLQTRAGRLPAVFSIYQSWAGDYSKFPWREANNARKLGKPLHVCWEPWEAGQRNSRLTPANIAAGICDSYIRQYASEAKKFGGPILLRFAHEMNGDWYPWGTAYSRDFRRNNNNFPAHYVAMWKRVVSIFKSEGATNVLFVWAPNIFYLNENNSLYEQKQDLKELFPGDQWVDWIGLSVYNDGAQRPWRSFQSLFGESYQFLTTLSLKPLMIAEMGVSERGAPRGTSKAAWIEQTLVRDIPFRYPRVRMVNWFCRDKTREGEANYRFDSSPSALAAFRLAANSPNYSGQVHDTTTRIARN